MTNILIAGVLASSILTTNLPSVPNPSPSYSFSQVMNDEEFSSYIVQEGDYLSMIAEAYFGSEDYWTNIWNDNPELKDASQLEAGMVLKIRTTKTMLPEALKPELETTTAVEESVYSYTSATPSAGASASVNQQQVVVPVTIAPTQAAVAAQPATSPQSLSEAQITYLGNCEAGMNPARNSGNGYYGAFQFSQSTWNSMGTGYARADLAPLEVQKAAVQRLLARSSIYTQFPGCSKKMRAAGII